MSIHPYRCPDPVLLSAHQRLYAHRRISSNEDHPLLQFPSVSASLPGLLAYSATLLLSLSQRPVHLQEAHLFVPAITKLSPPNSRRPASSDPFISLNETASLMRSTKCS